MKLINAYTMELDEQELAVSDVLNQLDLEKNARKNSVGFITCSYDFVESGIVKAICDALPFDVVGCTTLANANNTEAGTMLLCLTVLTADDCCFVTAITGSIRENLEKTVNNAVQKAASELGQPVNMALAFLPMFGTGGEIILDALDDALGGAPVFGTVGCDYDTSSYNNTFVIHNGKYFRDCLSFLLISGNINPRFIVTSTSEQNLRKQQAVVTSSEGCLLKRVNDMTAKEYFESVGLVSGKGIEGMISVPFVVDYGDGSQQTARAIYGLNEDGSAVCGGVMPEGSPLYIGRMDVEDILLTAKTSINSLLENEDLNGIIIFSCVGRNMVLAVDSLEEIDVVKNTIGDRIPWHLAYSGGECCPVYTKNGSVVNRFHNFTFIGCAL